MREGGDLSGGEDGDWTRFGVNFPFEAWDKWSGTRAAPDFGFAIARSRGPPDVGLGDGGAAAAAPQARPRPGAPPEATGADAAKPSHRSGRGRARIAKA